MAGYRDLMVGSGGPIRGTAGYVRPIPRRRRGAVRVHDPGIPGGDLGTGNTWYPSQGQARRAALIAASRLGPGHTIRLHTLVGPGQHPHYHVVDPRNVQVSGHFFFGGRPPRKSLDRAPGRYESEAEPGREWEANYFVVKSLVTPEGHERLTRAAALGLTGLTPADLASLIVGVRRVDTASFANHFRPSQQRRHALRRSVCQGLAAALGEARAHLARLHGLALGSAPRATALEWIGEALHLIQDAYSEAHVERDWTGPSGPRPIVYIRYFGLGGRTYPVEHRVAPPPDPRDIVTAGGALSRPARAAIAASREYLRMALRHLAGPRGMTPAVKRDLRAFLARHFLLSPRKVEPKTYYPHCP